MEIFKRIQDKQEEIKNSLNEYKKLNEVCFFEVLFFLQELSQSHKVHSSLSLSNAKLQHSNNKTEQVYSIYFSTIITGNIEDIPKEKRVHFSEIKKLLYFKERDYSYCYFDRIDNNPLITALIEFIKTIPTKDTSVNFKITKKGINIDLGNRNQESLLKVIDDFNKSYEMFCLSKTLPIVEKSIKLKM